MDFSDRRRPFARQEETARGQSSEVSGGGISSVPAGYWQHYGFDGPPKKGLHGGAATQLQSDGHRIEEDEGGGGGGGGWSIEALVAILSKDKKDQNVLQEIRDRKVTIIQFTTAFDTWQYTSGPKKGEIVEEELKGLRGNTVRSPLEIRIRASLSDTEASSTLFHEMGHVARGAVKTKEESLQQEIDVRVDTEDYRIRHGMQETKKGYRGEDGTPDREAIDKDVKGSSHYNPKDRKRISRRYEGEAVLVSAGKLPAAPGNKEKPEAKKNGEESH